MTCEYVQSNAVLLVYDELADDAKFEMERHLERCAACSAEVKAISGLKQAMSASPVQEPSPNLLAASRMRLSESLEEVEHNRGWQRFFTFDLAGWLHQVRMAPAVAMVLFVLGFAGGTAATWRIASGRAGTGAVTVAPAPAAEASIAGIRSINQDPADPNKVEIKYDTVTHQQTQGSLNDQKIQQLLLYAAHNNLNPGVRNDSIDLLTRKPEDQNVREALIYGLRYDSNTGVRLKAIDALKPYVKEDTRVRDAVLEAVLNDASPGVRTEAILALDPVKADTSVRRVLQDLAARDPNPYIQRKAQDMLNQVGQIE